MTDIWSRAKRSEVMSRIRSKNTKPELILRSLMHRDGFRYRLHVKSLPGAPDLIFPKYRAAIFVNGCFWHMHSRCKTWKIPKSNGGYWIKKLQGNAERDRINKRQLRTLGWRVISIWECQVERSPELVALRAQRFLCRNRERLSTCRNSDN